MTDLADVLKDAIEAQREAINAAAKRHDGPIDVRLSYHPLMGKVELVIQPSVRTPPYRVPMR